MSWFHWDEGEVISIERLTSLVHFMLMKHQIWFGNDADMPSYYITWSTFNKLTFDPNLSLEKKKNERKQADE